MTRIKLKGLHRIKSKGRYYYYHRATKTRLNAEFGTAEFLLELAQIEKECKDIQTKIDTKFGTLGFLVLEYKKSEKFERLAPRSKKYYRDNLEYLIPLYDMPLTLITPTFIRKLRDKTLKDKKRSFTNHMLAVMGVMFTFGVEYGYMDDNPKKHVTGIPKDKRANTPIKNRVWTEGEQEIVLKTAPRHLLLPIAVSMFTGIRQGDVLTLHKNSIKNDWLEIKTNKTGQLVKWPIHPRLNEIIQIEHKNNTVFICVNSMGNQWTSDGFKSSFQKFKKQLEQKNLIGSGLTFHGLRRTVATSLREKGLSNEQIATALGHSDPKTTNIYSKDVDLNKTMENIYSIFNVIKNKK